MLFKAHHVGKYVWGKTLCSLFYVLRLTSFYYFPNRCSQAIARRSQKFGECYLGIILLLTRYGYMGAASSLSLLWLLIQVNNKLKNGPNRMASLGILIFLMWKLKVERAHAKGAY